MADESPRCETYKHIREVARLLGRVATDLIRRAAEHDASKLEPPESETFERLTPLLKATTYGSEEYHRLRAELGEALAHHYEHNRHHPEHWASGIQGMNLVDLLEMLVDWLAATRRHADGDIRKSIEINAERFGYGEEIKRLLLNTLPMLEG